MLTSEYGRAQAYFLESKGIHKVWRRDVDDAPMCQAAAGPETVESMLEGFEGGSRRRDVEGAYGILAVRAASKETRRGRRGADAIERHRLRGLRRRHARLSLEAERVVHLLSDVQLDDVEKTRERAHKIGIARRLDATVMALWIGLNVARAVIVLAEASRRASVRPGEWHLAPAVPEAA